MLDELIIDVGMHKGEDAEFYLKKGFRVVGIEANPELCTFARGRLAAYCDSGQLTILNVAITEGSGPVTFYQNHQNSEWGTTRREWDHRNRAMGTTSVELLVEGVNFEDVLRSHGTPYYLKIDIEGNDRLCLEAILQCSSLPRHVSLESSKTSWQDLLEEFSLLEALGYSHFKLVNQLSVPKQVCPDPPREAGDVQHDFQFGATGLFGEEVPGPWLSKKEALRKYRMVFAKYWLFSHLEAFRGLHKKLPHAARFHSLLHPGWYDTHAKL